MKEIYKIVADVLIDYERMCQSYPWAVLTRNMGYKFAEFDKEFDLTEFQIYLRRRDEKND